MNDETKIDGAPSAGSEVKVDAVRLSDGTLTATEVKDESDDVDDGELTDEA